MRCCVDNCFLLMIFFSIETMLPRCKAPWSWHISNIVVSTRSQEVQIQYCFIIMVKDGQSFLSFPLCLSISFPPARKNFSLILSTPTTLQLPESRFWICHSRDQPCLRDSEWLLYSGLYCTGLWHSSAPLLLQMILLRDPQVCCPPEFCYRPLVQAQEPTSYIRVLSLWSNTP